MPARRFFLEGTHSDGDTVTIAGKDAHKIVRVLRLQSGDCIELVDSAATVFDAELIVESEAVRAVLRDGRRANDRARVQIDVAQAVPKGQKMDFIVEKLSELGVSAILPFESERCIARGVAAGKVERWRRLAQTAAQQSGRTNVARVDEVISFGTLVECLSKYDCVLFPWEVSDPSPLREVLPELVKSARRILVVIGPEGGFSHSEAASAERSGAAVVSLGRQILRTETAALYVVSVLSYLTLE